jgi:hypothetical protein
VDEANGAAEAGAKLEAVETDAGAQDEGAAAQGEPAEEEGEQQQEETGSDAAADEESGKRALAARNIEEVVEAERWSGGDAGDGAQEEEVAHDVVDVAEAAREEQHTDVDADADKVEDADADAEEGEFDVGAER